MHPSLRTQTQQALWVHKWNKMDARPFQLMQTCSCKLGNRCKGCHLPLLCGTTFVEAAELVPCPHVPTPGAQPLTLQRGLAGALFALSVLLLSGDHISSPPDILLPEQAQVLRRLGTTVVGTGPQRTPDSHTHCSPQCDVPTKTITETTTTTTAAFPTDAKEKERNRRNE